jgi:hypothetical protein
MNQDTIVQTSPQLSSASGFGALVWVGIILRGPRLLGWILLWQ